MIFEIIQYIDGGLNDKGSVIKYVRAKSIEEAKEKYVANNFQSAREISDKRFYELRMIAVNELRKFDIIL